MGLVPSQLEALGQDRVHYGTYLVVPMQTDFAGCGHFSSCICNDIHIVCEALDLCRTYVQFSVCIVMTLAFLNAVPGILMSVLAYDELIFA